MTVLVMFFEITIYLSIGGNLRCDGGDIIDNGGSLNFNSGSFGFVFILNNAREQGF